MIQNGISCNNINGKAFGVNFGHNHDFCIRLNWSTKLDYIKELIKRWEMRNFTFHGKISVIKSTLLPMLTYLLQSILIPKEFLNELNKIFF